MKPSISIFWFRRDLRLEDNAGLYHALKSGFPVLPLFIFDKNILDSLENKKDKRVHFIHSALVEIQKKLVAHGGSLHITYSTPLEAFSELISLYKIAEVYTNHDYEPYAKERDETIKEYLGGQGITLHSFKDQVIFEKSDVIKNNNEPYTVYTPYSKRWKEALTDQLLQPYPTHRYFANLYKQPAIPVPSLEEIGFRPSSYSFSPPIFDEQVAINYDKTRDFPSVKGTTRLSVHLRFGTVSVREIAAKAKELNGKLLNELIWREFYQMILWHFPHVVNSSFKKEYDGIKWRNNENEFSLWCSGQTGYPIVDAGMRELNETGFMHNRVRMITASFLTKDLLIDWRWGEAYFAEKLLDYDLSANNGGWQWAAGSGCDAAPYFRIFNPYLQTNKFDPQLKYIRQWVPEFEEFSYASPVVDHTVARERCLKVYKEGLQRKI